MKKMFLKNTDDIQEFIDNYDIDTSTSDNIRWFSEMTGFNSDYGKTDFITLAFYLDFIYKRENVSIKSSINQSAKYVFMDKLKDLYNMYTTYILSDMTDLPCQIYTCRGVSMYDDSYDEDVHGNPEPPFVIHIDDPVSKNIYTFIKLMEGMSKIEETDNLWYTDTWIDTDGYEDSENRCTLKGFLTYTHFATFDSY